MSILKAATVASVLGLLAFAVAPSAGDRAHHHKRHHHRHCPSVHRYEAAVHRVYQRKHISYRVRKRLYRMLICEGPHQRLATKAYTHKQLHERRLRQSQTSFVISGATSTFGYPAEGGTTADGGSTARVCIATRDPNHMDRKFLVTVNGHSAVMLRCDWGPASWTGRAIDITGLGVEKLGYSQGGYPTGAHGTARLLK